MATDSAVQTRIDDGVLTVTLNRPEKLNAMRLSDFEHLAQVIRQFGNDDAQRILVLTGNGRGFCAGEDLNEFLEPGETGFDKLADRVDTLQEITRLLVRLDKPTIAAINGAAVGFGFEVTLACDIRIASTDAYFWFSEVKRGLLPTNASFYLLPRLIGVGHTARMMLGAERVGAEDALDYGIISTLTKPVDLIATAESMARGMLDNSTLATTMIKGILRQSFELSIEEIMALESKGTLELAEAGEVLEGAKAFAKS